MMVKCWEYEPENRPSFQELHKSTSSYSERIAGYLEMSVNPFKGAGDNAVKEEEETGEIEEYDVADPEVAIQVYPPSFKKSHFGSGEESTHL